MKWPPLLYRDQPRAQQIAGPLAGPIVVGIVCGWLLGVSAVAYYVLTLSAIIGGILAGYEHDSLVGGAARGAFIGFLFSLSICEMHRLIGNDALANTPKPIELIIPVFTVISLVLGVIGATLRRRTEARVAA
jgi:hypothetical protein